ncbi:alpha/beta hydrolase [Prauserella marina]|uniref:Pimeloyl-ACP methyl ester carboxylesterase n=1 Tax=Prauserella marina TaxID=530584 RepID=A0A222VJ77_9PSEU|nr:alpha/beta hydrolase [Prauserella marina]ASR33947.1 alpha/beta hydrolase [Prauserella marina]PWV82550.1 pimeloyl-ACP methyl ester carboxylesterase [Prauserella marina]SDC71785.1 Pimeloyl-ACP methyl ester carboxylesterase [Prauserella marina]
MRTEVIGADGVRIGVRIEGTDGAPPIVFVHGWAQSARAWDLQFADRELRRAHRLVAFDLRGHGTSDVPAGGYDDPVSWADDLAAVLAVAGTPAVLVGWSYGGLVISDYLRVHGTAGLAGIVLVGAITEIGKGHPGGKVGPAMRAALPAALDEDIDIALPALTAFSVALSGETGRNVPGPLVQALLGTSLTVQPSVRAALFRRDVGSAAVLSAVDVPSLVVHGDADAVVDITAGEYAAGKIPGCDSRWWSGVGHLPFAEDAQRFNTTLLRFAGERVSGA